MSEEKKDQNQQNKQSNEKDTVVIPVIEIPEDLEQWKKMEELMKQYGCVIIPGKRKRERD